MAAALGLLALIASEVLVEARLAASAPEALWSGLVAVFGVAGLPFIAPFTLTVLRKPGLGAALRRIGLTLVLSYVPAALLALAFAPHPVGSLADAAALTVVSALSGTFVLLPAAVYAQRKQRPDALMIAVLVAACVLMPIPAVGGVVLAALLLWRRSLVERMP